MGEQSRYFTHLSPSPFAHIWGGFEALRSQKPGFCEVGHQPILTLTYLALGPSTLLLISAEKTKDSGLAYDDSPF
jgi:hypothetical protein